MGKSSPCASAPEVRWLFDRTAAKKRHFLRTVRFRRADGVVRNGLTTPSATYLTNPPERGTLKLDESCTSNPKSEISNWTRCEIRQSNLRFRISDLRCRTRPISKSPSRQTLP